MGLISIFDSKICVHGDIGRITWSRNGSELCVSKAWPWQTPRRFCFPSVIEDVKPNVDPCSYGNLKGGQLNAIKCKATTQLNAIECKATARHRQAANSWTNTPIELFIFNPMGITISSSLTCYDLVENMVYNRSKQVFAHLVQGAVLVLIVTPCSCFMWFFRTSLEYAAPVWLLGLTLTQHVQLEHI